MRFWIRTSDLKTANYCNSDDCALARAIKRKMPDALVVVTARRAEINGQHYKIAHQSAEKLLEWACGVEMTGFHVRIAA